MDATKSQSNGKEEVSVEDKILLEPYEYLLQVSGGNFRIKLINAFNYWLQIPEDKLTLITEIVQMLHEASLLIDDIEDDSELRRGIPVAHHIFGTPHTINTANYLYFIALQKSLLLNHPSIAQIFAEQMVELHRGQGHEIHWRDNHKCPSEQEYLLMASRKTGGLFILAVKFMQLFSSNKRDLESLIRNIGLFFQIRDDYANLKSTQLTKTKGFAEDLTEGKFSFPVIHAIKSHPDDHLILNILKQKSKKEEVKRYCIEHMERLGSFAYTREVLMKIEKEIFKQINELGGNDKSVRKCRKEAS